MNDWNVTVKFVFDDTISKDCEWVVIKVDRGNVIPPESGWNTTVIPTNTKPTVGARINPMEYVRKYINSTKCPIAIKQLQIWSYYFKIKSIETIQAL